MCIKIIQLFSNWVVERCLSKHDKFYLRGELVLRKLGGVFSFSLPFHLWLSPSCQILSFVVFSF
jgi:hypothetical protein